MRPIHAIENMNTMMGALNQKVSQLGYEVEEIAELWEGLGRANGQRDDHAAEMLYRLEPHLRGMIDFLNKCRDQVIQMKSDPFGRKEPPAA